jgi:hypothetical protein
MNQHLSRTTNSVVQQFGNTKDGKFSSPADKRWQHSAVQQLGNTKHYKFSYTEFWQENTEL